MPGVNWEAQTRVDHVGTMLDGNANDLITSKIGPNGGILTTLADDVGLIGLCENSQSTEALAASSRTGVRGEGETNFACAC